MSIPQPASVARPRPYRDILTPAWHTKFIRAAVCSFALCYVIGATMLSWESASLFTLFKSWIMGSLLFIPALCVFILKVADTHIGSRTTPSPFDTFYTHLLSFNNLQLAFWYGISTIIYTEILVWSADASDRIWLTSGDSERKRLQERAIFLRVMMAAVTVTQQLWHTYLDKGRAPLPIPDSKVTAKDAAAPPTTSPIIEIKDKLPSLLKGALTKVSAAFTAFLVLYYVLLRRVIWDLSFSLVSSTWSLPRYTAPTGIAPALPFFSAAIWRSLLLVALWDFSVLVYDAFISQAPLKLQKPLTDGSKDPNGSLITGLRAKRAFAKSNAFWELYLIVTRFPARRATIYTETDRQPASTWVQIRDLSLAEINKINARIHATKPQPPPPTPAPAPSRTQIAPPLKNDQVTLATPPAKRLLERQMDLVGKEVKAIGTSPGQGYKPVLNAAEWTAGQAVKRLPSSAKGAVDPGNIRSQADGLAMKVLVLPYIGPFFQKTFARRATAVVCGSPYANTSLIVCAISSLSSLVTNSLKEDQYGQVASDVSSIIRSFTSTLLAIEGFMSGLQPHWTDLSFKETQKIEVEEVEIVKAALREGLVGMVGSFGEFAPALGISAGDLNAAKKLTAGRPEMKMKALK